MSGDGEIEELPLAQIYPGPLVRAERLDLDHVALLQGIDTLPPITVRRTAKGLECLDGAHRTAARRQDKHETIRGVVRELDDAEALELAYSANNDHGLPLTLAERKNGARRFITETQFSDATIAKIVGLHRDTVAGMRPVQPAGNQQVGRRQGADGKDRPADKAAAEAQRAEIRKMLTEHPDLSLNEIARRVGCAPMTVAKVRTDMAKIAQQESPAPPAGHPTGPAAAASTAGGGQSDETEGTGQPAPHALGLVPQPASGAPALGELIDHCPSAGQWSKVEAMQSSNAARDFARYMDRRMPKADDDAAALAGRCPAEMRDQAAFAARNAAAFWTAAAEALTNPTRLTSVENA